MNDAAPSTATPPLHRRFLAEFFGTAALVAIVVGSGIAAQRLSTDPGLQLLENSLVTALGLAVLIAALGPVSGAHFNPVVTVVDWLAARRSGGGMRATDIGPYLAAQFTGGIAGTVVASIMFETPLAIGTNERATIATLTAEVVATAGLVATILLLVRSGNARAVAPAVGAYIGAAYWFTSSTSFANPAVTLARLFTDTFAGIAPSAVLPFIAAQLIGAFVGFGAVVLLMPESWRAPVTSGQSGPDASGPTTALAAAPIVTTEPQRKGQDA